MLDSSSRYTIATRMNDDRIAEARRAHLLRVARDGRDEFETETRVHAEPSSIGRAVGAAFQALRQLRPHQPRAAAIR